MTVDERVPDVSPELPGRAWRVTLALLQRLPQAALSRALGTVADTPLPKPLRRPVLGTFAKLLGIDVGEAELPIAGYSSLNAFFVRRLRPGVRTWPQDDRVGASPVDGVLGRHGTITNGRLIQAKGRDYSAADLMAGADEAARYEGGPFITIYLSPRHYHRIHAPCSGTIAAAAHVPGALLPVNEPAVRHLPDLFPRNERVICTIDGAVGRIAVIAVGAYNVGRISTAFDTEWVGPGMSVANRTAPAARTRSYDPAIAVRQGDEIMAFHLGSTVVLMGEPGYEIAASEPGTEVRLGDVIMRAR